MTSRGTVFFPSLPGDMARALGGAARKWGLKSPARPSHGKPVTVWAPSPCLSSPTVHLIVHFRSSARSPLRESCFPQSSVGGWCKEWTVPKATLAFSMLPVWLGHRVAIVHPAYSFTAQFNLLSVTLWCHRTTWTGL